MIARAAVIWGAIGLVIALIIDFVTPSNAQLWLYAGFGFLAGGGSWALNEVRRIPQGLVVGTIFGFVVGLIDGTMTAAATSAGTLNPTPFILIKYASTVGLFALLAVLPWTIRSL